MPVDRKYVASLTKKRYLAYIKLFPSLQQKRAKEYTMLILSLAVISIFGIFAIQPTVATILELRRKFDDAKFVSERLEEKITNLSVLKTKYDQLGEDYNVILAAIPENPEVAYLLGQIQAIAKESGIEIIELQTSDIELATAAEQKGTEGSFTFTLQAEGSYPEINDFLTQLGSFDRVITLGSFGISRSLETDNRELTVQGTAYFKKL
jgi:Tfp pilus assembly protein PilO